MARKNRSAGRASFRILAFFAICALAGGGYLYWQRGSRQIPDVRRLASFTTNLSNLWPSSRTNPPTVAARTNAVPARLTNAIPAAAPTKAVTPTPDEPLSPRRPVRNVLEAQIALARLGISPGCIDGSFGNQTSRALLAYQIHNNLSVSGQLDAETKAVLMIEEPLFTWYAVSTNDRQRLMTVPATWLGKSEQERLDYESVLELVAEHGRASMEFVRKSNPQVTWTNIIAGTLIKIPKVDLPSAREKAAFARIHLYSKTLNVFGQTTNLLAYFPCSIASRVEKRPVGALTVAKAAANPNYLFDPEVFPESEEAKQLARKIMIPPGPNNPVGTAWIGLDRPGYGIHGTPKPEQVGRTESHGCFRLANWNAEHLLQLVWVGMPVYVEP